MKPQIVIAVLAIGCHRAPSNGDDPPAGLDDSGTGMESEMSPDGDPGTGDPTFDPNGVEQIYPTRPGKAAPWTLGFDDWQVRTRSFGSTTGTAAATVVTASGQVRMTVKAETSACEGNTDHGAALAQGYMCSPNDWYAFEMTAYVQLVDASGNDGDRDWTWYGGGGRHTGSGPPTGCLGSAYKANYHYADAKVRLRKESFHVNYSDRSWKAVAGGIDYTAESDRWLGMKLVRYEFTRDGERGIRLEQWLDLGGVDADGKPANEWVRANVEEDHPDAPSWGEGATGCGAPAGDQPMLWGGPWVTFRWDDTTSRTRLMSVREIVAPVQ